MALLLGMIEYLCGFLVRKTIALSSMISIASPSYYFPLSLWFALLLRRRVLPVVDLPPARKGLMWSMSLPDLSMPFLS
jgi:hypothetical protein